MQHTHAVVAVAVTYHPDPVVLRQLVKATLPQVTKLVLIDNGSPPESLAEFKVERRIDVVMLGKNLGIAAAFNEGIRRAMAEGAEHVLLLDQDSIPEPGMVAELSDVMAQLKRQGRNVAVVGPRHYGTNTPELSKFVTFGWFWFRRRPPSPGERWVRCDFLISSGCLICASAIQSIGLMEEELFIDHVDTEWCLRAQSKGFEIYGATNARLQHSLGEYTTRIWFLRWRNVSQHKPFRYYYIIRNSVLLLLRPYVPSAWRRGETLRLFLLVLFFGLIRSPRWKNFTMMWRGFMDGLKGITGSLEIFRQ
ncbi:MAG: glycosyltransferase family 2 protein [Pseudomonadota bacterium]|jgi:rhamnosyltransferase